MPISISVASAVCSGVILASGVPFLGSNASTAFIAIAEDATSEPITAWFTSRPVNPAIAADWMTFAEAGFLVANSLKSGISPSSAGTAALIPPVSIAFNGSRPVTTATAVPPAAPLAVAAATLDTDSLNPNSTPASSTALLA